MEIQKSIVVLALTFFSLTGTIVANESKPFSSNECKALVLLNKTMQENLELTDSQQEKIWMLNQRYWFLRKSILNTANKTGQNTAVLACWDQWRLTLTENLDETQIAKFMEWQSQVDLLSETPY